MSSLNARNINPLVQTTLQLICFSGKTVAQIAIRWLLQQKVVSSVVIGATSVQQLEDNLGASAGWTLSDEEVRQILIT